MRKITGSLVVCVAAAAFTAGALVLNDDSPTPTTVAAAATAPAAPTAGPGYAGQPGTTGARAAASGASVVLQVRDFTFSPATVRPGGSVVVQNRDGVAHTVTADGGRFDSGPVRPQGSVTITAPTAAGSYRFTCVIHPQMSGTLVVR
jgi:plastocyanin